MSAISLFITCARGAEPLLAAELAQLGATDTKERAGGVAASTDTTGLYRVCLWSRLASRVLLPLARFSVEDADALYAAASAINWPDIFAPRYRFAIEVAGHHQGIANTHYAALRVKDAVVDGFRAAGLERPSVDTRHADIRLHLYLATECSLSLDLSGESLHRRGYRVSSVAAPLKETLASAILTRCGWPPAPDAVASLMDPMCGSGTLVIEAALMCFDIAPGLARRTWGFDAWENHQPDLWSEVRQEALDRKSVGLNRRDTHLRGFDHDRRAIAAARANAGRAGLADKITFEVGDALALVPAQPQGLLVCNLPYGERLASEAELIRLYSLLGANLKTHFTGWHCGLFTPRTDLTPRLGVRAEKINSFYNGAIECRLLQFPLAATTRNAEWAEDFANRLRKNQRRLGRWARRVGVSCYRLYDADLPDYALAVDLYQTLEDGLHVHVQEYAPPRSVDPVQAEKRLRVALATLLQVLEITPDHLHYKLRHAQKGASQYQRNSQDIRRYSIDEHGCRLFVDFDSYLDTGLFLDHRPLRLRLRSGSHGRRVLNLFCYTGSATAQGVLGGATSSVSVDLSKTYLEWARDNLRANAVRAELYARLPRPIDRLAPHALIRADAREWLAATVGQPSLPRFELIFIDPPTFSNSKAMDSHFDIQHDHAALVRDALRLLAPGGTLYFSTNRRGFKLDPTLADTVQIHDITKQTLDEDFRRPRPAHRCWEMTTTSAD